MNYAKIRDLALEAAEVQKTAEDFEALAAKREREGRPLAADAARSSAESWRRAESRLAELIDAEMNPEKHRGGISAEALLAFNRALQA